MFQYRQIVLTAGFAMFSMFFGSGNLVFPILAGKSSLDQALWTTCGFIITAVVVPFLGLLGMILYDGDYNRYFSRLGKIPAFLLILFMLLLIGPFGVVPRCITVAFGGLNLMFSTLSYPAFSFSFCALVGLLIWRRNKVVDIIGLVLTPFKLGGIMLMMIVGLWFGQSASTSEMVPLQAATEGFFQGYQTMDLIAAFFFSSTTVYYLRSHIKPTDSSKKTLFRLSLAASLIGAGILSLAYVGFIQLGAKYASLLSTTQPEEMFAKIAFESMGSFALPIVSFTMAIACLATAVILTSVFVDFLQEDVTKNKISHEQSVIATLIVTFAMSLLGFSVICQWLGGILEIAYPALISLALVNIFFHRSSSKIGAIPFWAILIYSCTMKIFF